MSKSKILNVKELEKGDKVAYFWDTLNDKGLWYQGEVTCTDILKTKVKTREGREFSFSNARSYAFIKLEYLHKIRGDYRVMQQITRRLNKLSGNMGAYTADHMIRKEVERKRLLSALIEADKALQALMEEFKE